MYLFSATFYLAVIATCYLTYAAKTVVSNWRSCSSPDALIVTLWGVSVSTCAEECDKRPACLLYNYRKRVTSCELLYETGKAVVAGKGCVSGMSSCDGTQYACSAGEICNTSKGTCHKDECRPYVVESATVYGNVLSKGSKINVVYDSVAYNSDMTPCKIATCGDNGTWEHSEKCITVPRCPASFDEFTRIGEQMLVICINKLTQPDAAEACRPYGELVRMETMTQHKAIKSTLEQVERMGYWIQGKFDVCDKLWKYNDGTPINLQTFSKVSAKMNDEGEFCIRFHSANYYWHDKNCYAKKGSNERRSLEYDLREYTANEN